MKLESYDDVLASIAKNPERQFHLLLGNGFSISYDPKIFSYNALHDFLVNLKDTDLGLILDVIQTRNFEVIMQYLDSFATLLSAFGATKELQQRVAGATEKLKYGLLEAVKALHPKHVFEVPEDQSVACSRFLKTFLDTDGKLFSTNYDLLLYWMLMRNNMTEAVDGCGRELENEGAEFVPVEDQEWSELTWGKYRSKQNVFYVHGALPFFDTGSSVVKEEYDVYNYLLENISARMQREEYPIFVTAGDGQQKLQHITHNQYLTYCYDALCNTEGSLVTYGFRFGEYDYHIIDAINRAAKQGRKVSNRLWSIYIGVYSDEDIKYIEELKPRFKCKVHIFDAKTAKVWGN